MPSNNLTLSEQWDFGNVLFVGAGASVPFGLRTTDSFLEYVEPRLVQVIKERDQVSPEGNDTHPIKPLFERSAHFAGVDKADVETVLDYLDNVRSSLEEQAHLPPLVQSLSKTRSGSSVFSEYAKGVRKMSQYLEEQIVNHYSDVDGTLALKVYRPIIEALARPGESLPVFTTNYDGVFEALGYESADLELVDGFAETPRGSEWRPQRFNSFRPDSDFLNLLLFKLHGSTSWFREEKTGKIRKISVPGQSLGQPRPILIYPTQFKSEAIGSEPFRTVYDYLKRVLAEANCCIVIGFSFRDPEINESFSYALNNNERLKIIVVNPVLRDPKNKFRNHVNDALKQDSVESGQRVRYLPGTIEDADLTNNFLSMME